MSRVRTGWCNHFRSMMDHKTCEAGVPYEQFKGKPHAECPCFYKKGVKPPGGCDKAQYPTPEEEAAHAALIKKRIEFLGTARQAIVDSLGGPWRKGTAGASGVIDCPVCGAKEALRFTRAGYNGHIHAQCSTGNCVNWME